MKGLLLKDFYQLIKYCKMFFLVDTVFLAVSFFSEENALFISFPVMFSGILPLTLLSYDERGGWSDYCGILPYSEKQIVSAKYLFGLLSQAVTVVVVIGVVFVRGIVYPNYNFLSNLSAIGIMFVASLLFPALCLPFCYKFGSEKGRIGYFVVIALTTGCMPLYSKIVEGFEGAEANNTNIIFPLIFVGIAALYVGSWLISIPLLKSVKK